MKTTTSWRSSRSKKSRLAWKTFSRPLRGPARGTLSSAPKTSTFSCDTCSPYTKGSSRPRKSRSKDQAQWLGEQSQRVKCRIRKLTYTSFSWPSSSTKSGTKTKAASRSTWGNCTAKKRLSSSHCKNWLWVLPRSSIRLRPSPWHTKSWKI